MTARTIAAATIVAAARPRQHGPVATWQGNTPEQQTRALLADSASRLEGAAYALHGICTHMEETRCAGVMFVAAGLLDQAHVLRAARQAEADVWKAEEAAEEAKRATVARPAKSGGKAR